MIARLGKGDIKKKKKKRKQERRCKSKAKSEIKLRIILTYLLPLSFLVVSSTLLFISLFSLTSPLHSTVSVYLSCPLYPSQFLLLSPSYSQLFSSSHSPHSFLLLFSLNLSVSYLLPFPSPCFPPTSPSFPSCLFFCFLSLWSFPHSTISFSVVLCWVLIAGLIFPSSFCLFHLPPLFPYQSFMILFPMSYSSLPLTTLLVFLFSPVSSFFGRKCH